MFIWVANKTVHTKRVALMQPSNSGLLVTCAYLDHTTLPVWVTRPNYDTLTYITVPKLKQKIPFVITPRDV